MKSTTNLNNQPGAMESRTETARTEGFGPHAQKDVRRR
jgi:hypothetical protein